MTDAELELAILRRYVEQHDAVGTKAHKCARELDMRVVISDIIGRPADEAVVKRWHSRLAPPSPYPAGVLRPCSDSQVNNGPHQFHARAYYEPGKAPAWERIAQLESEVPNQPSIKKEKEQKFGILNSLRQATTDFTLYSSGLGIDSSVGVLFLDIDNFKSLNTRFMESVVDQEVLIPFQQMLSLACLHRGDAYRHGGEEFLMLLPNHTAEEVMQFAERIRRRIETEEFSVGESSVQITVSIGIAFWPKHGVTLDDLIEKANSAEHEAKAKGKNRIEVYEE
jgi:diguanylate cyclase (GGDEF)-like protein